MKTKANAAKRMKINKLYAFLFEKQKKNVCTFNLLGGFRPIGRWFMASECGFICHRFCVGVCNYVNWIFWK